jgi:hypothetical protein
MVGGLTLDICSRWIVDGYVDDTGFCDDCLSRRYASGLVEKFIKSDTSFDSSRFLPRVNKLRRAGKERADNGDLYVRRAKLQESPCLAYRELGKGPGIIA